jgi:hypothetical protein
MPGPFNRRGTGELLADARELLEKTVHEKKWRIDLAQTIRDNLRFFGVESGPEAYRYSISDPTGKRSYIAPLAAKAETILNPPMTGQPWFSVSEKVIGAAADVDGTIVFTYIASMHQIYVTDTRSARRDEVYGPYLRFGQRYFGWFLKEAAALPAWLDDPNALGSQTYFSQG